MKINAYAIITRAVEEGINYGIGRLFKHSDEPMTEERLRERSDVIYDAIMNSLCEVVEFSDEDLGVNDD